MPARLRGGTDPTDADKLRPSDILLPSCVDKCPSRFQRQIELHAQSSQARRINGALYSRDPGYRAARCLPLRRRAHDEKDRRDGGSAVRNGGAAQSPMSPLATAVTCISLRPTQHHDPGVQRVRLRAQTQCFERPIMVNKDGYVDIPNKPVWGRRIKRRSVQQHAAGAVAARDEFPGDGSPYFQ